MSNISRAIKTERGKQRASRREPSVRRSDSDDEAVERSGTRERERERERIMATGFPFSCLVSKEDNEQRVEEEG